MPSDIYREFHVVMGGPKDWRVTDPASKNPASLEALPNSILRFEISDLKHARKAEVQLDRWGGHPGTAGKAIRFNDRSWLPVPELATTPAGAPPECFMFQDNPSVEIPLADLREGVNTLEGTAAGQNAACGRNWGQWGWYGAVVRIYYDASKPHPAGRIAFPDSGATLGDRPLIQVTAEGPSRIDRVDLLAHYDGLDADGDGVFNDWHHAYRHVELTGHAATAIAPPFQLRWDTAWVPDQPPRSVKLMARIRDSSGTWFVTPVVDRLTLARTKVSVKLFKPHGVPPRYWARAGRAVSSKVTVPASEPLARAVDAAIALRTWNGYKQEFRLNNHHAEVGGADHKFAQSMRGVPVAAIHTGENTISFQSDTKHHGVEVLWPGPALLVRYGEPAAATPPDEWLNPDYSARIPVDLESAVPLAGEKPVEIDLDFTKALREAAIYGAFDERSIRVVDSDARGIADAAARRQFDPGPNYDPERNAAGTLTVLVKPMPRGWTRRLMVYFATRDTAAPRLLSPALVRVTTDVEHQDRPGVRISTPAGDYTFEDAGPVSLRDREGNEWLQRGTPASRTRVEARGPLKVRLRSESRDGAFATVWDIFPGHARVILPKPDRPFFSPAGGAKPARIVYVVDRRGEAHSTTSGSRDRCCEPSPASYTIGFAESEDSPETAAAIRSASNSPGIRIGRAQARPASVVK
jgi:hypothetical protein